MSNKDEQGYDPIKQSYELIEELGGRYSNKKDDKSIKATIIFPDPNFIIKNNDNKDAGAITDFWSSGKLSKPDPKLSDSEYLKKISKESDERMGYSESTKDKEQAGTFTSQISGFNRKRGRRS